MKRYGLVAPINQFWRLWVILGQNEKKIFEIGFFSSKKWVYISIFGSLVFDPDSLTDWFYRLIRGYFTWIFTSNGLFYCRMDPYRYTGRFFFDKFLTHFHGVLSRKKNGPYYDRNRPYRTYWWSNMFSATLKTYWRVKNVQICNKIGKRYKNSQKYWQNGRNLWRKIDFCQKLKICAV